MTSSWKESLKNILENILEKFSEAFSRSGEDEKAGAPEFWRRR